MMMMMMMIMMMMMMDHETFEFGVITDGVELQKAGLPRP